MGRMIDADELSEVINSKRGRFPDKGNEPFMANEIIHYIDDCETVEAEPVIHAEWRFDSGCGRVKHYRCTRCGRTVCTFGYKPLLEQFPYCNCGAKMGGPEDGKAD